jgi:rubrerythrin
MPEYTRREFICLSVFLPLICNSTVLAKEDKKEINSKLKYPLTISTLRDAYMTEIIAHRHYNGFRARAIMERYPNIAYLFHAFSISERIHADNYERILSLLNSRIGEVKIDIEIKDTKDNLQKAAKRELGKIEVTYPRFLKLLQAESCNEAIVNCMYSWKSHRQHEKKVTEILKYSGWFFGSVVREIEGLKFDFHVCRICGSTIDESPKLACDICNYPTSNYEKVNRPS